MNNCGLTIFTPTYNRANLLPRAYESLVNQSCKDFEWLVIDDGSTDNTEDVVKKMADEGKVRINYIKKENGGKISAHNLSLEYAKGMLFICLDSDDVMAENAVEIIIKNKHKLKDGDCGFVAYKALENGRMLSYTFDIEAGARFHINRGVELYSKPSEFSFVFVTSVLIKYPFPQFENERFITESVVYDKMDIDGYSMVLLPEVVEICEYQDDGLSANGVKLLLDNPIGYQVYHMQRIEIETSAKMILKNIITYHSCKRLSNNKIKYSGKHKFLVALLMPTGILGSWYYLLRGLKK